MASTLATEPTASAAGGGGVLPRHSRARSRRRSKAKTSSSCFSATLSSCRCERTCCASCAPRWPSSARSSTPMQCTATRRPRRAVRRRRTQVGPRRSRSPRGEQLLRRHWSRRPAGSRRGVHLCVRSCRQRPTERDPVLRRTRPAGIIPGGGPDEPAQEPVHPPLRVHPTLCPPRHLDLVQQGPRHALVPAALPRRNPGAASRGSA